MVRTSTFWIILVFLFPFSLSAREGVARKPADIFDYNMTKNLPILYDAAKEKGKTIPSFKLPTQKDKTKRPSDVRRLMLYYYKYLTKLYGLPKIKVAPKANVLDKDLYQLSEKIHENLKEKLGEKELKEVAPSLNSAYFSWKSSVGNKVTEGDVYHLLDHFVSVSRSLR